MLLDRGVLTESVRGGVAVVPALQQIPGKLHALSGVWRDGSYSVQAPPKGAVCGGALCSGPWRVGD